MDLIAKGRELIAIAVVTLEEDYRPGRKFVERLLLARGEAGPGDADAEHLSGGRHERATVSSAHAS
jgi:hypothetical protein